MLPRKILYLLTAFFALCFPVTLLPALQAQIATDGTLGAAKSLTGPDYRIGAELGKQAGGNLFHSFGEFNIRTGESASFAGPDSVNNIISRVTGGSESLIDGMLRSEIPGADMYFLNPAGFIFGKNASLDISGSFHVSTADFLRLGDSGRFDATQPENSVLTSAPPSAFGFLDPPEKIDIKGKIQIPQGKNLSLTGGDINIRGGSLTAPGGEIHMAAAASAGEIPLTDSVPDTEAFSEQGKISVSEGGYVNVSGNTGGDIYIRGGQFEVSGEGSLLLSMTGNADGGTIDIRVNDDLIITDNGSVSALGDGNGGSGDIRLEADRVKVTGGGFADVSVPGAGQGGDISVTAREALEISGYGIYESGLYAQTAGYGSAGNISISADTATLSDQGKIAANTYGQGNGGNISLNARQLEITGGGSVESYGGGSGHAGNITVTAGDSVRVSGTGFTFPSNLDASAYGDGDGGNISLTTGKLLVADRALIQNTVFGKGQGGDIALNTDITELHDGGQIVANILGAGQGGNISAVARDTLIISGSGTAGSSSGLYVSAVENSGDAGDITISAGSMAVSSGGAVSARTLGAGHGGDVTANADYLNLTTGGTINTSTSGSGAGGNITVNVRESLKISEGGRLVADSGDGGDAGSISVSANILAVTENGVVKSDAAGKGEGGNITLTGNTVEITQGYVSSTSAGKEADAGKGGDILITAQESALIAGSGTDEPGPLGWYGVYAQSQGKGNSGSIAINSNVLNVSRDGMINGQTFGSGTGGNITLDVSRLEVLDGGTVTADTFGSGTGGNVSVAARESVKVSGAGMISENSWIATEAHSGGNGGDLTISATHLTVSEGGKISVNTLGDETWDGNPLPPGRAGNMQLNTDRLEMSLGGAISAETKCEGPGGDISIVATKSLTLSSDASISAKSFGSGDAGDVNIWAGNSVRLENSSLTTEAEHADGGNITAYTGNMLHISGSEITATVGGGKGTGGNIHIDDSGFAILRESKIIANADEGAGGNIKIIAEQFLKTSGSVIDASSKLGIDGNVEIDSPETDIGASLAILPGVFPDAESFLCSPCETRTGDKMSSLVIRTRDGLPSPLDDYLPSPPIHGTPDVSEPGKDKEK
jgi:filamentous hemagglutinin family protein